METLIVLLQVTYSVEYFIAFVAPKLPGISFAVATIGALGRGAQLVEAGHFDGAGEHGAEAVLLHPGVGGAGYVCEGVALRQVVPAPRHLVAGAVDDGLVVGRVVVRGVVALVGGGLGGPRVGTVLGQVGRLLPVLGHGGQGLECTGVTGVAATHVQVLYFVTRVVRRTCAKR